MEEFDYKLLARYMAGECTDQERKEIEAWAGADPTNNNKLKQFKRIWNTSAQSKRMLQNLFDADKQWNQLQARIQEEENLQPKPVEETFSASTFQTSSIHSMTQKAVRIAAIFLVAGLIGILAYQNLYQPEPQAQEPVLREINTANAQRANLTLGDGTKVMLNAGSTVKFPDQFEADVREVFLEGEAYFDVVTNPDRPFVIHSRGSEIKVLGTSFSVRSYAEEKQVRVVVEEGRVSFGTKNLDLESNIILSANEMGAYNIESNDIETRQVDDMQLYLSWRNGYLKFREAPMEKVATALERRYGIDVAFEDTSIKEKSLTAFLKSRSIRNVLDVVAMSLDIEYRLEEEKVTFYK